MSVLDPIYLREPGERSVPDGSSTMNLVEPMTPSEVAAMGTDWFFFPFSVPSIYRRLTNPAEQSAASGSVVTNDSPGFLDGVSRELGTIYRDTTDGGKAIASGVGSVVGSLLPWWVWAILGVGVLAWLLSAAAPYLRKT